MPKKSKDPKKLAKKEEKKEGKRGLSESERRSLINNATIKGMELGVHYTQEMLKLNNDFIEKGIEVETDIKIPELCKVMQYRLYNHKNKKSFIKLTNDDSIGMISNEQRENLEKFNKELNVMRKSGEID